MDDLVTRESEQGSPENLLEAIERHGATVCFTAPTAYRRMLALGVDHILFGTDYPFEDIATATRFLETAPISPADRAKIAHLNAERLLRL